MVTITAFQLAQRFVGIKEVSGTAANPQILAMLNLDQGWPVDDSVPWCSAFVNYICWLLRLPRSKDLAARSWLQVGIPISLDQVMPDSDIVILKRGEGTQPGPEVIKASGHVGFYAGREDDKVLLLAGNQGDSVNVSSFPIDRILGIRRLF